jgi:23S rRNA (uracil1939-C5)-methyltransferase
MAIKKSGPLFFKPEKKAKVQRAQARERVLQIDRLSSEGRGMAFAEQKPVFVAAALPGETVRVRILEEKREFAIGQLLEVLQPSAQRQVPRCPHFDNGDGSNSCGGCQLQMLDYAQQVEHKQQTLKHLLAPFAPQWSEPIIAEPWHYRHRARLTVSADAQGRPQLGFKAPQSHRSVAIKHCDIIDRRLLPLLEQIPQWLAQLTKWQRIKEITLVVDATDRLAIAYDAESAFPATDRALLQQLTSAAGIALANAELTYSLASLDLQLTFQPRDFTQVNPAINDLLARRCVDWLNLQRDDRVADFFCGLGNFSLAIAQQLVSLSPGGSVCGFEVNADMVARADMNARNAGLDNTEFAVADLFAPAALSNDLLPTGFNKVLLDPPRAGAKLLCEQLAKLSLQTVLYVSCNPHTLIRDLEILVAGGWRVRRAALVDMFPQTGHIETLVLCSRDNY